MEDYKETAEKLPAENAMLVHASAFAADGRGILIMAPSGIGKTTQTMLWKQLLGNRFVIINDDKPVLKLCNGKTIIESSPLCGKERLQSDASAELSAVIFLDGCRDWQKASIEPLNSRFAAELILKQVYMPEDPEMKLKTVDLINDMFSEVPMYLLKRNKTIECAKLAIETVFGNFE